MKKRIIKMLIAMTLIAAFGIRVYCVNSQVRYPINKYYDKFEEVAIENDFFNNDSEKMNGYSITVTNTEMMNINDFYDKYNVANKDAFLNEDYVFLVKVNIKNISNKLGENAGINFGEYMITNGAYMNLCNRDAYPYVNDFKYLSISLREGTDKDFIIPFTINKTHITEEKFKKGTPQLIISLYPTRKAISL